MTKTTKTSKTSKTATAKFYATRAARIAAARARNQKFGLSERAQRADRKLNAQLAGF